MPREILLFALFGITLVKEAEGCQGNIGPNGRFYRYESTPMTFGQADGHCSKFGMTMADLATDDKASGLLDMAAFCKPIKQNIRLK